MIRKKEKEGLIDKDGNIVLEEGISAMTRVNASTNPVILLMLFLI